MLVAIVSMTLSLYADGTSCSIRGLSGETITLTHENATSGSNCQVCVKLENTSDKQVSVIVKCYDAYTDQCVGVVSVSVPSYGGLACFNNLKPEHPYYFRVSDAHCG